MHIKHEIFDHKKWKRKVLLKLLRKKSFRKKFCQSEFFYEQVMHRSPISKRNVEELTGPVKLTLENFFSRNGNLSPYEVIAITSLIAKRNPKRLLEIGTFDGNTTLQMALNSADDALIHTIDLPEGELETRAPVLDSDLQFIADEKKQIRKFQGTLVAHKVHQHFGDSTNYDFSKFTKEGSLDFIFVDGGHSYPCVQSDTENALKSLAKDGCILWHDFTPHFGGVFQFLTELSQKLPLVHIEGTNLVMYRRNHDH
ncbi:MAG: class I SAM-dependent methyltransferase [Simkaniaceae bacterium]|nr:class I SAM-dependent methyltransferase [Candidatus Sacchlamyda saccharinae]